MSKFDIYTRLTTMAKTNTERFANSMIYLIGIDPDLAVLVTRELHGREDEVGGEISLDRTNNSKNQRRAHRALLL